MKYVKTVLYFFFLDVGNLPTQTTHTQKKKIERFSNKNNFSYSADPTGGGASEFFSFFLVLLTTLRGACVLATADAVAAAPLAPLSLLVPDRRLPASRLRLEAAATPKAAAEPVVSAQQGRHSKQGQQGMTMG